ncbi:hypothetical protein D3C73_1251360 [compost metagenome]
MLQLHIHDLLRHVTKLHGLSENFVYIFNVVGIVKNGNGSRRSLNLRLVEGCQRCQLFFTLRAVDDKKTPWLHVNGRRGTGGLRQYLGHFLPADCNFRVVAFNGTALQDNAVEVVGFVELAGKSRRGHLIVSFMNQFLSL